MDGREDKMRGIEGKNEDGKEHKILKLEIIKNTKKES